MQLKNGVNIFIYLFCLKLLLIELIYKVVLVSAEEQSESVAYIYTHIHSFFRFYTHVGHYRIFRRIPEY